ncbi:MAG TPA: hypothetical protein VN512_02125 [Clostridia bacterium]|nr:hypothetical protein [Clostridia bacterium]
MRKLICLALFVLFLCTGCVPPSLPADAPPSADTLPSADATYASSAAPTAQASVSPAPQTQDTGMPPAENRRYYEPEGTYRYLSGRLTGQGIEALATELRLGEWKSLARVFRAFGVEWKDAAINDIRKCDLTNAYEYGHTSEFYIRTPCYDEAHGVAYIDIAQFYLQNGMHYLLVFQKTDGGDYSASSIVTLREDYYAESPTFRFEKLGKTTYLIWNGLSGHGTGFLDYGEAWYDLDTGLCVYSYSTDGYDAEWQMDTFDTYTWKDSVSYASVAIPSSGDFYLDARTRLAFSPTGAAEIVYEYGYRIYYDEQLRKFYTVYDALLPLYVEAEKSSYAEIRTWAARRKAYIDGLRKEDANPMPGESDRKVLKLEEPQIEPLPLHGQKRTLDQLFALCVNLNGAEAGGYTGIKRLLDANGIGVSFGAEGDPLGETLEGISGVSCTVDMDTCKERVIFLHLSFLKAGQRRGLTFVYGVTDEADTWTLSVAASYPLAEEYGTAEGIYPGVPFSYGLKIPVGNLNGHAVYQSLVCASPYSPYLSFLSDFYDAQGNRHTLDFSAKNYSFRDGIFGSLSAYVNEADSEYRKSTSYATVHFDGEWARNAPFVAEDSFDGIGKFFEEGLSLSEETP